MIQIKNHDDGRKPFPDFPGNSRILLFPFPGFSDSPLCTLNSALLWSLSVKVSQSQSKRFGKAGFDLLRAISTKKLSQFKVIQTSLLRALRDLLFKANFGSRFRSQPGVNRIDKPPAIPELMGDYFHTKWPVAVSIRWKRDECA
jgi:hypothetical protein